MPIDVDLRRRMQRLAGRRREQDVPKSLEREPALALELRIQALVAEMNRCVEENTEMDLGAPPHREITEALHRLVYGTAEQQAFLQVRYGDGTRGERFPLHALCLPDTGLTWREDKAINVGTLTFRHADYDRLVDIYLIRDRETRALTNQGIEALAYRRMGEILSDPELAGEAYLALYQAGLEPLVVGMYRCLVEHLQKRRKSKDMGRLTVRTVFFLDDKRASLLWG